MNAILAIGRIIADAFIAIWDSVKNVFVAIFQGMANIFSSIWKGIVNTFSVYIAGLKRIFSSIIGAFASVWAKVKDGVVKIIAAFINLWKAAINAFKSILNTMASFFVRLCEGIVSVAINIWNTFKGWIAAFVESIKSIWGAISGFFSGLWEGIVGVAKSVWGTLTEWFTGLIDGIKNIWNGITGFFSGLWEAIMNGPTAAIEYIRTAFTSLFSGIEEKLFGFINKVKEGWDKVTGFFGNAVTGVVNFFTGGDPEIEKTAPTKVNDMILTPEGQFQTSPDDYIMAMKDPTKLASNQEGKEDNTEKSPIGELINSVISSIQNAADGLIGIIEKLKQPFTEMSFLLQSYAMANQLQPAYATASQSAMAGSVGQTSNYAYNTVGGSSTINAQTSINITVPQGTSQEQSEAIIRQVNAQFEAKLAGSINSSRANIPSPEIRRH
jgi:phage-related protein